MKEYRDKMGLNATWSMAVGGMVGGGIFSVLGVIIAIAGQWAWVSFLVAGIIAVISAYSYSRLSVMHRESGGAYTFLREMDRGNFAAGLAWVLILGYILTISVYAFTFGHYVALVFGAGTWVPRVLAFVIIALLMLLNLRGVSESSFFEIVTVWGKLIVLVGLAGLGLWHWDHAALTAGIGPKPIHKAIAGAATIFMAYEGFQLLSYDYHDIHKPEKNLPRAILSSVVSVAIIYVLVTLGATMLVGAGTLVEQKEVALSIAGKQALGFTGLMLVTIAAAFSTGSAINATLFSTARLMAHVAAQKDLPVLLQQKNSNNVPYVAIIIIAGVAAVLAAIGSLSELVDAASLVFLVTFGIVNFVAFRQRVRFRWLCFAGAVGCVAAIALSAVEQISTRPIPLALMAVLLVSSLLLRPMVLRIRGK